MTFAVYYENNGEYPPPEEIEVTRGLHRVEGRISDFIPEQPVQYLDADAEIEFDNEIKRIHFNKLDILSDGSFVAEIEVIDNWFTLAVIGVSIVSVVGGTMAAIVFNQAGKASEKSEKALQATGVNLQWVAVIVVTIGVVYMVIRK